MTPVALIVEYQTPDLLELCLASLRRFAPQVTPIVLPGGPGAEWHAHAIETWRSRTDSGDPVILLDTDVVICSERWWPALRSAFARGVELVGGHRSRGEACQMFLGATPLLHASMLAMTRHVFDRVLDFKAVPEDPELGHVTRDTAWRVSCYAMTREVIPYFPVTHGPRFPGLQVGEYGYGDTYWSHLWRGTGMPAGGRLRQGLRRIRAACGHPGAITTLRAQQRKTAWMARAWEIVTAT